MATQANCDLDATRVAAIVLAAGLSSRMGRTKALLPFGGEGGHAIDRVLEGMRSTGVAPVVVVTGYDHDAIEAHIASAPVCIAYNAAYREDMFLSVLKGAATLAECEGISGFFLLPVDYPLVKPQTLAALAEAFARHQAPVIYPTFCGKKGHPPLISAACIPTIIAHDGTMGLKGALQGFEKDAAYVEVDDPGVLEDMDTPLDYFRLSQIDMGAFAYRHCFLQGDIWIGKSALLRTQLEAMQGELGGFYVERQYKRGHCHRFVLRSVREDALPKHQQTPEGQRVFMERTDATWTFVPSVFEQFAATLLHQEREEGIRLFLLDEIGGMELQNPFFMETLNAVLTDCHCVGVFKSQRNSAAQRDTMQVGRDYLRARGTCVERILHSGGRIITLREDNGDETAALVARFLANVTQPNVDASTPM